VGCEVHILECGQHNPATSAELDQMAEGARSFVRRKMLKTNRKIGEVRGSLKEAALIK